MPTKTLVTLLRVVIDQGYPLERALDQIDLDFNPLLEENQHRTRIPSTSYSKLYQLLMGLLQDEAFGLGKEYSSPPGTFKMMCLFIINCPSLEAAFNRSAEFYDYCNQYRDHQFNVSRDAIYYYPDGENALVLSERYPADEGDTEFIGYANILLMMYRFYSWLIGKELPLKEVHLRASEPGSASHYEQLFNCPVRFDQPNSGLLVSASLLQYPLVQNEETLREFLRQTPYRLVKPGKPDGSNPLTRKVEQLLINNAIQKPPTAEFVAEQLNMSPRTLHRKLTDENTSFQLIKDEYRKELAIHYVNRPELTIDAIAALMGFQDNSAFYRSFKKWTGQSPGNYRATMIKGNENRE
ncbi:MAG: AraC family transcriptional regulator [Halioglobus sp.]